MGIAKRSPLGALPHVPGRFAPHVGQSAQNGDMHMSRHICFFLTLVKIFFSNIFPMDLPTY